MGSYPNPRNGIPEYEHEYINKFQKLGETPLINTETTKKDSMTMEEWRTFFNGIWKFPGEKKSSYDHPAPFPEELPYRLIRMYSCTGDIVLDPFMGSGTTCKVADELGRKFIGIDSNKDYVKTSKERLGFYGHVQDTILSY
jgi:site-specific DNA-methyltransferase (adenine-specific)